VSQLQEDIDKRILKYLSEQDWPVTTEMVAENVKISWNTAQIHLYKLSAEGLVKGKRVGRQNQWVLTRRK
jgi:predicted ArsR family transcriptional regulator